MVLDSLILICFLLPWQLEPANGAGVIVLEPRLQALWVIDVAAGHEHALLTQLDVLAAHCARGRLQVLVICGFLLSETPWLHWGNLAVLLLYFDDGQLVNGILARLVLLSPALCLLLGDSPDHFEDVVVGVEALLEVTHEVVGSGSVHGLLHSQELVRAEQVVELDDRVCYSVHLLIDLFLLLSSWFLTSHATSWISIVWPEALAVILN